MANKDREHELFRAVIKDMFRKRGLKLDRNELLRGIGQEVKIFNEWHKLSVPMTVQEFLKIYLEFMKEAVAEHFAEIEAKIAELEKGENKPA